MPARPGFLFGEANAGHLRIGEYHIYQQAIINPPRLSWFQDVVNRDFALLNRDVDDLVRPGAIAGGKNMRRTPVLHGIISDDASVFGFHPGGWQIEGGRVWHAPKRK